MAAHGTSSEKSEKKEHHDHPLPLWVKLAFIGLIVLAIMLTRIALAHMPHESPLDYERVNGREPGAATTASPDTCPAFIEGMGLSVCDVDETGTTLIPVMGPPSAHVCFVGHMPVDRMNIWYTDADGTEHAWTGSEDDRATPKAYWRFQSKHGIVRIAYTVKDGAC